MIVSWLESFYAGDQPKPLFTRLIRDVPPLELSTIRSLQWRRTAFSSPRFPHRAKCALRLALELPAATPHRARNALEKLKRITRGALGRVGDRQSSTMAASLKMSAANRYILHSCSSETPKRCAKTIVAIRPVLS